MKKAIYLFLILAFVSLSSYSVSFGQEVKKEDAKTTKVEAKKEAKKVKTVKKATKEESKCEGCPHKANCSKEEKK